MMQMLERYEDMWRRNLARAAMALQNGENESFVRPS